MLSSSTPASSSSSSSSSPKPTSLLANVTTAARKTFVTGFQRNFTEIRNAIKEDIKEELRKIILAGNNPQAFDAKLQEMLDHRCCYFGFTSKIGAAPVFHLYFRMAHAHEQYAQLHQMAADEFLQANDPMLERYQNEMMNNGDKFSKSLRRSIATQQITLATAIEKYFIDQYIDNAYENSDDNLHDLYTQYKKQLGEEITAEIQQEDANAAPVARRKTQTYHGQYFQFLDDHIPGYNANWIENTNFIAAEGPGGDTLPQFLQSILFANEMRGKPAVTHIVALGNCLSNGKNRTDFENYCYDNRSEEEKSNGAERVYIAEDEELNLKFQVSVANHYVSPHYCIDSNDNNTFPGGFVQSKLTVVDLSDGAQAGNRKEVMVTLIALPDGEALYLNTNTEETKKLKEILWQLSQKSSQEATLVHCTAGVGRTGHCILTLELLKHYKKIFTSSDPEEIQREIHKTLNNIRINRPALVARLEQFTMAIQNADLLYQYALENKYIQTAAKVSAMSFLAPPPASAAAAASSSAPAIPRVEI